MIVAVAVRTGTITSATQRQAASCPGEFPVEKIDIVIGNDNGVIHDDPEDHNERRDRNLMQRDPDCVHHPEGDAERYGNGESRDRGDPDGQQNNRDEHHRCDGEQEFMAKMRHAFLNDLRLIGDEIDPDIRRQQGINAGKNLLDSIAQFDDIFSLLHFNGEHRHGSPS